MALIAMLAVLMIIRSQAFRQDTRNRTYDFAGAALSTAALLTFLLTVSNGSRIGWTSPPMIVGALSFVFFLTAFIWWESRGAVSDARPGTVQEPGLQHRHIHQLHLISRYNLRAVPYAVLPSGRARIHARAGWHSAAPECNEQDSSKSSQRSPVGPLRLEARSTSSGFFCPPPGLFVLASLTVTSSVGMVLVGILIQSAGSGLFQPPNSASIFSAADSSRHGVVAAFVNLSRNSGNVTGIAIATSIVTAVMASGGFESNIDAVLESGPGSGLLDSFMTGLKTAFLSMGILQVVGAVASVFKSDARPTPSSPAADTSATPSRSG